MSIIEIEAAISKLPADQVSKLTAWLEEHNAQLLEKKIKDDFDAERFDSLIAEAYASGEPLPLTKSDIDKARHIVKDRITARNTPDEPR